MIKVFSFLSLVFLFGCETTGTKKISMHSDVSSPKSALVKINTTLVEETQSYTSKAFDDRHTLMLKETIVLKVQKRFLCVHCLKISCQAGK